MILWIVVGLMVWILCILFMLAIIKGGRSTRRHGYEQKLYSENMVNPQNNVEVLIKEEVKRASLVIHS